MNIKEPRTATKIRLKLSYFISARIFIAIDTDRIVMWASTDL